MIAAGVNNVDPGKGVRGSRYSSPASASARVSLSWRGESSVYLFDLIRLYLLSVYTASRAERRAVRLGSRGGPALIQLSFHTFLTERNLFHSVSDNF